MRLNAHNEVVSVTATAPGGAAAAVGEFRTGLLYTFVRSPISLSQEYSADNAHAYKEGQTADFRKEEPLRSTPISTCIAVTENISKEKISNQGEI